MRTFGGSAGGGVGGGMWGSGGKKGKKKKNKGRNRGRFSGGGQVGGKGGGGKGGKLDRVDKEIRQECAQAGSCLTMRNDVQSSCTFVCSVSKECV